MAIPEGWELRTLGQLSLLITKGTTPTTYGHVYSEEGVPFFRVENITMQGSLELGAVKFISPATHELLARSKVRAGDLLFSIAGALGRVAMVPSDVIEANINQAIALIRIDPAHDCVGSYLTHSLMGDHVQAQVELEKSALAQANLNLKQIGDLSILLPPLPEQKKIAAILSSVDETIAKTEAVIAQLQIVKKAMMEQLLTKGMPGRHTRFKQTEIGEIPEEWEVVSLERAASRIVVGVVIQPASYYVPDGIPALRSLNVKDDEILLDKLVFFSDASNQQLSKSQIRTGDVLTVRTGVPGVSACVPAALNGANCIDLIITTPSAALRGEFLSRFINSDRGRGAILKRQGGLAQQHFNVGEMKQLLVPIPSIEEQDLIIERLQVIDVRLGVERALAKAITIVKAALSSSLLSGEIRVIPEVAE